MLFRLLPLGLIILVSFTACEQQESSKHVVAFYNLENLFDTINSPEVYDEEYTPKGFRHWDSKRYAAKLSNMSNVIAQLGKKEGFNGPTIIGLCEMENKQVLKNLINTDNLKDKKYEIIHFDSPDKRGIDVALFYKPDNFKVTNTQIYPLIIHDIDSGNRIYTRDQLLVSGELDGDKIHLIVNHWPSRYGGKERSIPLRKEAALLNRQIIDSILQIDTNAKIITMGDLNDDPTDESVETYLNAHSSLSNRDETQLYNPLAKNFKNGEGSLFYRGKWNLFDQIIISQGLLNANKGLKYDTAIIYNKPFLIQQEGKYKGYLLRTFGGRTYLNGFSDHLPVYIVLKPSKN